MCPIAKQKYKINTRKNIIKTSDIILTLHLYKNGYCVLAALFSAGNPNYFNTKYIRVMSLVSKDECLPLEHSYSLPGRSK